MQNRIKEISDSLSDNEFFDDLKLNESDLETASELQASLYFKWSTRYQIAFAEKREAERQLEHLESQYSIQLEKVKIDLDIVMAEIGNKIRNNPEDYGLKKITDSVVSEALNSRKEVIEKREAVNKLKYYKSLPEYQEGVKILHEKKRIAGILAEAKEAMLQKSFSIKALVDLYVNEYFVNKTVKDEMPNKRQEKVMNEQLKDNPIMIKRRNK